MIGLRYLSRDGGLAAGAGDWQAAVADIRKVVALLADGHAGMEPESVMPMGVDPRNKAYGLPAWLRGDYDAAGLKWAVHRAEADVELPSILSATFVNRLSDGRPLGVVESALLTRMRTGAVSALAIETLLPRSPSTVTVLGAGAQAAAHVDMLRALFPSVAEIRLWNRSRARRDALIDMLAGGRGAPVRPFERLEDAVEGAEAVLTCTSSPEPLLGAWAVRPGRLIVQVGYHEVDFEAIDSSDHVVVDLWGEFAERSAKSLFQMYRAGRFAPQRVAADLAGLLVNGWRPPAGASLYFSSFGLNLFDIALAARVLRRADRDDIGTRLAFL
jgi:Predicted ornithine cyclodeaminase, mu-crystallin homolog